MLFVICPVSYVLCSMSFVLCLMLNVLHQRLKILLRNKMSLSAPSLTLKQLKLVYFEFKSICSFKNLINKLKCLQSTIVIQRVIYVGIPVKTCEHLFVRLWIFCTTKVVSCVAVNGSLTPVD